MFKTFPQYNAIQIFDIQIIYEYQQKNDGFLAFIDS